MSWILRDNYNLGEEKRKKSEKKASVIHRYEGSPQLGNGKKKVWVKLILTIIGGGKRNSQWGN